MPALTSYSPYETLVFVQNVIQYGTDAPAFQEISTQLTQNQLIRENVDSDASKFSPDALQHLFDRVIGAQKEEKSGAANGDGETQNANPRKRKLSASPQSKHTDTELLLQELVNTLYARFRTETIKELREQEQEYGRLQGEINQLEGEIKAEKAGDVSISRVASNQVEDTTRTSTINLDPKADPVSAQLQANLEAINQDVKSSSGPVPPVRSQPHPQPVLLSQQERANQSPTPAPTTTTPRPASAASHVRPTQPPPAPLPTAQTSPSAYNRNVPQPPLQHPGHGAFVPPPHPFPYPPQGVGQPPILPPIYSMQRVPSHEGYPQHQNTPNQGRVSPMSQQIQQPYQVFPQYQQGPPPNGWPSPIPQQYPQPSYSGPQQPYHPQTHVRYPQVQTPNQAVYQPHPHTAPIHYPGHQQWRGPPPPHYQQYSVSANSTPVSRSGSKTPVIRSASSTPWKSRQSTGLMRPRSPSRLQREVSPLSETDSSLSASPRTAVNKPVKLESAASLKVPRRDANATPVAGVSRSQSVISNTSEAPEPPKRRVGRPPKVKAEVPSTPAPIPSDSEQRSSGRRGRARTGTLLKKPETIPSPANPSKRKREAHSQSPVPTVQSPTHRPSLLQHVDPTLVMVSKTFGRTSQLLINEITSHKLAGIFAKPLSERDAPGYKTLIHRPQDLKTIKAAISKGSRAAIAAIEELDTRNVVGDITSDSDQKEATPTPLPKNNSSTISTSGEGPIGNGFYLVRTTEDLIPPKGIVNSAQLEMELVRMFANAVMFNPLPTSERGFGHSLRLRKRGGEPRSHASHIAKSIANTDDDDDEEDEDEGRQSRSHRKDDRDASEPATTTSESDISGSSADEGGIIADAREMFEDVERQVAKWKEVEGDRLGSHGYGTSGTSGGGPGTGVGGSFSTLVVGHVDRHASVDASSMAGEYDEEHNERDVTPAGGAGMRKRRRIGDH